MLVPLLDTLRQSGKKVFLATNSMWVSTCSTWQQYQAAALHSGITFIPWQVQQVKGSASRKRFMCALKQCSECRPVQGLPPLPL